MPDVSPGASLLPERIAGPDGLLLRRWQTADAEALGRAVGESVEHLRPWMDWAAEEPLPLRRRRARIEAWGLDWAEGRDVVLGVFLGEEIIGGCGLHRRIAPDGLEIGYWIHPAHLRRGWATCVAGLLTDAALGLPEITHVEIHHAKANQASAGVPRKLGFSWLGEGPGELGASADVVIKWRWRMDRASWEARPSAE